jgi:hypothetical protein
LFCIAPAGLCSYPWLSLDPCVLPGLGAFGLANCHAAGSHPMATAPPPPTRSRGQNCIGPGMDGDILREGLQQNPRTRCESRSIIGRGLGASCAFGSRGGASLDQACHSHAPLPMRALLGKVQPRQIQPISHAISQTYMVPHRRVGHIQHCVDAGVRRFWLP